ncbi:MAG: nicotinate-nucleotide diphosphorylase (carboxylating) [Candidatus Omnitrophica bacterium 4484_213]|nr:MAG: nicotinate-nucleotide diphosphorylase (carboxylating) [Candidatus Omnitrophica bacterium 4484_213]
MQVIKIIKRALKEDIGKGDITAELLIPRGLKGRAIIIAKEEGIIAGLEVAEKVLKSLNSSLQFRAFKKDGDAFKENEIVAEVEGILRPILSAERVVLNFLSRLSGIATLTYRFVKETEGYEVKIMDTRKTTPNLRELEKYAVRVGGGFNHRFGLDEMILIKDNHIKSQIPKTPDLKEMIEKARKKSKGKVEIEIEVTNLEEFKQALEGKPDIIMLDNMNTENIRKAVELRRKITGSSSPPLEVSGGINLENVREIAQTGIEQISIGALTTRSNCIDFSLEVR